MLHKLILMALLLLTLIPLGISQAQDPNTGPDNACFEGGVMAGKCDTEWEFVCGWYLAQWLNAGGWQNPNNIAFPNWCNPESLLPTRPVNQADAVSGPICYTTGGIKPVSVLYNGLPNTLNNVSFHFASATCSTPANAWFLGVVTSREVCADWTPFDYTWDLTDFGLPGLYACLID